MSELNESASHSDAELRDNDDNDDDDDDVSFFCRILTNVI